MVALAPHIERVLDSARTAPSNDNAQPWRFVVDGDTISFVLDHERNASLESVMARLGIGAAVECACVSAARMGATTRFLEPHEGALVTMSITDPKRLPDPNLARTRRVTNRRTYDGRAIDDATLRTLRDAVPPTEISQAHWFGRERVRSLAPLVERAEELYFLDAGLREHALAATRFDVKDREVVDRGLSVGSLELTSAERAALVALRKPASSSVNAGALKTMATRARRQMESASGVLIITAAAAGAAADIDVGRMMQRVWMALTQQNLAAHPMTKIISLGITPSSTGTENDLVTALTSAFRGTFPNVGDDARIAFLMRFGFAEAPSCRVSRLPIEASIA